MTKITERKELRKSRIREFCIKYNLYTRGENEEYKEMMNITDQNLIYTDMLYNISLNIVKHSDLERFGQSEKENIETIMFMINQEVTVTFFDIEEI